MARQPFRTGKNSTILRISISLKNKLKEDADSSVWAEKKDGGLGSLLLDYGTLRPRDGTGFAKAGAGEW